jgi:hypothetical protein
MTHGPAEPGPNDSDDPVIAVQEVAAG